MYLFTVSTYQYLIKLVRNTFTTEVINNDYGIFKFFFGVIAFKTIIYYNYEYINIFMIIKSSFFSLLK